MGRHYPGNVFKDSDYLAMVYDTITCTRIRLDDPIIAQVRRVILDPPLFLFALSFFFASVCLLHHYLKTIIRWIGEFLSATKASGIVTTRKASSDGGN